jgi:CBS domain-containing protein
MVDLGRINNEGSRLVRDVMDPAVHLTEGTTVGDARRTLEYQNAPYAVVSGVEGSAFTIVTKDQLSIAHEDEVVQELTTNIAHPDTVEIDDPLDDIVQMRAEEFANNQYLKGIVVQEQGSVRGVLPREKIEEHLQVMGAGEAAAFGWTGAVADSGNYEGYAVDRLEGTPSRNLGYAVDRLEGTDTRDFGGNQVWVPPGDVPYICRDCPGGQECPDGPEVRGVADFDPDDPPFCTRKRRRMYKM